MANHPDSIPKNTRGPGYSRAPDHRVAFVPSAQHVVVRIHDKTIADSTDIVLVEEDSYPRRYYIARSDVDMGVLQKDANGTTYCPFKGLASYYSATLGDRQVDQIAWSYEQPYRESEAIRDRICFDADKVDQIA
ncbi:MAG TPA: DUF427 domain-containing protein [Kofleriaceae bacterium]|nr:DUF427 domain-containing protein [Kofleriaceae bacterium]